ncbi:unnamed protein product [Fraxinus pennsylvanica]|uniref:Uroporphyrinogen decarboxylase (URO-D) domain-containing protein n=1 Tax=Fraxinus pennsylvanica TaxID=56036 RepID=A0AAD2A9U5_9LAMI|nr:unnamed protein product [Fraxinus pennsylvanica]
MRQAGRYMAVYRKLTESPSFRERSEATDLIVEISLQPWEALGPDGVIIFSDILTPLPAFGVPFDIEEVRGPCRISLLYLNKLSGRGTSSSFGFRGSSLDDCCIHSREGNNTHIHNNKEHVPYSTTCIRGSSVSFDKGDS